MSTGDQHSTASRRLLLGMAGWPHPEWEARYFPLDLPAEWQFGYYSNEMDSLLLAPGDWSLLDPGGVEAWLDDTPDDFRFYLACGEGLPAPPLLEAFDGSLGALLVDRHRPALSGLRQLVPGGGGAWVDQAGEARLVCWAGLPADLREQRAGLEAMPATVEALVVDDPGACPNDLYQTRTLAELMGVA